MLNVLSFCGHVILAPGGATDDLAPVVSTGWLDCSGSAPDARSIQRAWRRMALKLHPDKTQDGDSSESFEDMTKLRDSLKDPDKFQIQRLLNGLVGLRAFGTRAPELRVTGAELRVRRRCTDILDQTTCFPYAVLSADFALSKELPPGATWTFALGAKNESTIQYHGDEEAGGYDACCDLRKDSDCVRRRVEPALGDRSVVDSDAKETGACRTDGVDPDGRQCENGDAVAKPPKGVVYESHDCPLGDIFSTEVSRPLHVMAPGLWAATLSLRNAEGTELACVAAAMTVLEEEVKALDANASDGSGREQLDQEPQEHHSDQGSSNSDPSGSETRESVPPQNSPNSGRESQGNDPATAVSFAFFDRGVFCEDGIDILEGAIDDYSVREIRNPLE